MLLFEFLFDRYLCYSGLVSLLTEKSSSIEPKKSATVKPKIKAILQIFQNFPAKELILTVVLFFDSMLELFSVSKLTRPV